ncbi:MAG: alkaline phosphatase family protein [Deltaproteobacteria bacterium]|nr:alkaline phosphatase family protein [Deltaproteobacteria bacterium]
MVRKALVIVALGTVSAVAVFFWARGREEAAAPAESPLLAEPYRWDEPLPPDYVYPIEKLPPVKKTAAAPGTPAHVFLIAVDGLCWKVTNTLLAEGKLPAIEKLLRGAAVARVVPDEPASIVNWTSLATGSSPSEHGISGKNEARNPCEMRPVDVRRPRLWEAVARYGKRFGIAHYPLTSAKAPPGSYVVTDDGGVPKDVLAGFGPDDDDPSFLVLDHADRKRFLARSLSRRFVRHASSTRRTNSSIFRFFPFFSHAAAPRRRRPSARVRGRLRKPTKRSTAGWSPWRTKPMTQ